MFKNTCRTCLNTTGEMVPIFSSGFYVKQLPKKLMAFAKVEISDNDQLPKMICKKCMFLADSFYCFKVQCEAADNQLKSLIRKNFTRDNSSNIENKTDSNNALCNKPGVALITNFEKVISDDKSMNIEAKKILEITQETKDSYFVEYISEEVRINVENAFKRRQEAERRLSMEKVSQSIKNLEGIEVVPVRNVKTDRSARNSRTEKKEIVVFPVKVPEKRSRIIETIVVDDSHPLNKRLKLPPETTVSKINGGDVKREDSIVYDKNRKLNFSTVRKVVKIDDEVLCLEPKQEFIKESERENSQFKYDTDVVVQSNDNEADNRRSQYSKIQIDNEESEIFYDKQEPNIFKAKLQEEPKDDEKNIKTQLFHFSNGNIPNNNKGSSHCNENKQPQDIISEINWGQNENKSTHYHSTIQKPVQFFRSLESKKIERRKVDCNLSNHNGIAKSTIGCIISEIDDPNFDLSDVSTFENSNDSPKSFSDYRTDRCNRFFIENEVDDIGNNCTTTQEEVRKNLKLDSISLAGNQTGMSGDSSSFSDRVTPLALLSVNSSGEENRTINLKIYKRNDSEKIKGTTEDDFHEKDESLVSSAHKNTGNPNLKIYQCTVCSMNFVSMPDVLKHNIEEHMADQSPVFCLICDKSFRDKPLLCDHVREHNGSEPYKCTFCPKQFTLKRNLKQHINNHINHRPFQCRICKKRFTEKFSLKSHMYLHNGNSPFVCKICNVSFNNKTNWRRHVVTIHEKLTVTVCKFCNKELPNKRSLRVHTRVHTGDRPYQCPHCDKRFTQQCNLNTHIHCHLNDRPFGCPHCSKGFNQRGTRDDHILTHTGEKPHKCMECDASFTVSSALKRHMWIHTDKDRPYNCDKCRLQFIGLYDLRRHLKIRHGEVSKLDIPRVERVLLDDETKEEIEGSDFSGESKFNESVESSRVSECSKAEITSKENSSLSCNVSKIKDSEKEEMKEYFLDTKIENLNNVAKKEMVNDFDDMLSGGDIGTRNLCTDINEH